MNYSPIKISFFLLSLHIFSKNLISFPQKMLINEPVVNLRTVPEEASKNLVFPTNIKNNPYQFTQLLLGEPIVALKKFIDKKGKTWLYIKAIKQKNYSLHEKWHSLHGWIQATQAIKTKDFPEYHLAVKSRFAQLTDKSHKKLYKISIGTMLQGSKIKNSCLWEIKLPNHTTAFIHETDINQIPIELSNQLLKKNIIKTAEHFISTWYSYGYSSSQGVDCSGLVKIIFLAHGIEIPSNAHSQFVAAKPIKYGKDLQPADLIFFCSNRPTKNLHSYRMNHVMLYAGNGNIIESSLSGNKKVRLISFKKRIGKSLHECESGDITINATSQGKKGQQYYIYFARFIS